MEMEGHHTEGDLVVYGMHGKCKVVAIESRTVGSETLTFYKLEPVKNWIAKPARKEPAIWVPVKSAVAQGLRNPLQTDQLEEIHSILSSREYFFTGTDPWHTTQSKLESTIRSEGAVGLAKAVSFLFVLRKRVAVPSSDMNKFWELCLRLLLREICDITQETSKVAEERITKLMRSKLLPDQ